MTGSEVEENKRKYVALRINDGQFIYFVIFSFASESSMNFHNLKLPVKGESPEFLSRSTVVAKAQQNTLSSKVKPVW